jgi:hypothetical protein
MIPLYKKAKNLNILWMSPKQSCIILPFNSPLRHMFNMATMLARENGVQGNLDKQWVGPEINENWSIDTMVLTPGRKRNSHI